MAKRPEDRYQTPAEVAAALTAIAGTGGSLPATHQDERTLAEPQLATVGTGPSSDTLASPFADLGEKAEALPAPTRSRPADGRLYWLAFGAAGGGVVLVILIGILVLLFLAFKKPAGNAPAPPEAEHVAPSPSPSKTSKKVDDDWLTMVAALPAEKQVDAVAVKLKELNKGFDGQVMYLIDHGMVTEFTLLTDRVTDISPLRALRKLTTLSCAGGWSGGSKLSDLTPLKEMKLTSLSCYNTQVADLTPLKGMKLTTLNCGNTRVSDLKPLTDMKLTSLECYSTPVKDPDERYETYVSGMSQHPGQQT